MLPEQQKLQAAIAALEAQRALLGDAVVDTAVSPLKAQIAALTSPPIDGSTQILKQVSILFLDVVGSTTLSQHLDPEAISAVMDGALARGTAVVEAHHGKVLQYAGDNLLAAFGADGAGEDDAERAVRCGLALLELGKVLGSEVQAAYKHAGFTVRVGIHTGGVLLGGGVDATGNIRGIAVHIAARMEQSAPSGALRISHDTYRHVRGVFDVEPQEPIKVKGIDEPIVTYLVQRAKPRAFRVLTRGIEGVETRMIGRDTEFAVLKQAFERLFAERKLVVLTVVAEAGLGKSRLLYEFDNWAEARPQRYVVFQGRATPQTQRQPYSLLREIVAWRLQIADDDPLDTAKTKLEQGIVPLFVDDDGPDLAEGHAHLLGHLIGLDFSASRHVRGIRDDPRQIRNRAFHAAVQMFRRVSARADAPVVLQLEDLHWADDASLEFLNTLIELNRDMPMLVLGFARPTLFERGVRWRGAEDGHQRIELHPLDKHDARVLAGELLKKLTEVPAALRELVTGGAEGNPFYMEELVKMLIDQGAIETHGQHSESWTLRPQTFLDTRVPQTLTGVLQARLDGLPAPEKLALQHASIVGHVFWDQALAALDARAAALLPSLVRRDLVVPRDAETLDGWREYAFRHQLLHQVTYDTVLKRVRSELHGNMARWLSGLTGSRANDFLGITADHYERAGDVASAAEFHARGADYARERFAHAAVLDHVQRALSLLDHKSADDTAVLRWRLLFAREHTFDLQGRRSEQRADLDALEAVADALDDDGRRAHVACRRSFLGALTANYHVEKREARQAMTLAERSGDHVLRLLALQRVAYAHANLGDPATGKSLAQQGLAEARSRGLRYNEALFLNALSVIANQQDDLVGFLELTQQTLVIDRMAGNLRLEAVTLGNLGVAWLNLGELEHAQHELEEGLRLRRANGDRHAETGTLCNLSTLALWQGDLARAHALARSAVDIALAAEAHFWEALALVCLGNAELALGHHAAATEACEQARARALEIGHALQYDATAGLARVALAVNDPDAALRQVEPVLAHLAGGGNLEGTDWPRLVELTCHKALDRAGDTRATAVLERMHRSLQARAATIKDANLRHSFLNRIPHHREIVRAWRARDAG